MYDRLSVEHATTVDRVVQELRRALFAGELTPGSPLREVALAEALGVARSTVREALGGLTAEGLVTRVPNRGVVVAELTAEDVRDVSRARAVIETAGLVRWPEATTVQRAAVYEALQRYTEAATSAVEPGPLTEAHLAVHRAFAGLIGSHRLDSVALGLTREIRLALATVARVRGDARQQVDEHRSLVALLDAGATAEAAAELDAHLARAQQSLLDILDLA